jgi:FKBP-type peptidyl-prolyl cis-trans isomerase
VYNKALFKTKSQHEAERILQSAMKSDYYKDSILKKYHDRIDGERGRNDRYAQELKAAEDKVSKEATEQRKKEHQKRLGDYEQAQYRAARQAAYDAQERELRRRNHERWLGARPGSVDYDEVDETTKS